MTTDICKTFSQNVKLSDYTTVKIGGVADLVCYPDWEEFYPTIKWLKDTRTPFAVLGRGSNTLVSDEGYRGVVVLTRKLDGIEVDKDTISCQCGASLINLSRIAKEHSLTGLEWAVGIPGSVGGAIVTNAGAWGSQIGDIVQKVEVFGEKPLLLDRESLDFSYRNSKVLNYGVVGRVILKLKKAEQKDIVRREEICIKRRNDTQPKGYSLGSIFKAYNGIGAGYYVDRAGLKGLRVGGAEVNRVHAGFITNVGNATASDYRAVIDIVTLKVEEKFGITLEKEIKYLGDI